MDRVAGAAEMLGAALLVFGSCAAPALIGSAGARMPAIATEAQSTNARR
jgi:hypothetical protein